MSINKYYKQSLWTTSPVKQMPLGVKNESLPASELMMTRLILLFSCYLTNKTLKVLSFNTKAPLYHPNTLSFHLAAP